MPSELTLPPLGEGVESAEVLELKVSPGDSVRAGQILAIVQAEKAAAELEAPQDGRIVKLLVKIGDTLQVRQPYAEFAPGDIDAQPESTKSGAQFPPPVPKDEPARSAGDSRADAKRAPVQETARLAGDGQAGAITPRTTSEKVVPAGPATRLLARKLGIDLTQVRGSGRGGRITTDDVEGFVRELAAGEKPTPALRGNAVPALPDFSKWGPVERQALDPIRRRTAQQMHLAWTSIPHVAQHDLADITELEAFRKQQEGRGPKLTITAFVLKAVAAALKQFPQFNASLDVEGGALVLKRYYHIGVAVDTDHGLLVPVLRDVDAKGVLQLAAELAEVAERARQRKLLAEEMRGGTFTITNLGGIGGTAFTPIINWPEAAILGLSRARLEPVVRDGQVTPRLLLPLSLSYDHRIIDGAAAARFTRRIAEMLENGWNLVMHGVAAGAAREAPTVRLDAANACS